MLLLSILVFDFFVMTMFVVFNTVYSPPAAKPYKCPGNQRVDKSLGRVVCNLPWLFDLLYAVRVNTR